MFAAVLQHRGAEPGDGKPGRAHEGFECYNSVRVRVLSKFLAMRPVSDIPSTCSLAHTSIFSDSVVQESGLTKISCPR